MAWHGGTQLLSRIADNRTVTQAGLHMKQQPTSKITNTESSGRLAEVAEHLPSKCEALSSAAPHYYKKKKKKRLYASPLLPDMLKIYIILKLCRELMG
jgi:hypothetical protein